MKHVVLLTSLIMSLTLAPFAWSADDIPPMALPIQRDVLPLSSDAPVATPATLVTVPVDSPTERPVDVLLETDGPVLHYLFLHQYLSPLPDNHLHPDAPMTRADFDTLLYKASGFKTPYLSDFAYYRDVSTHHWAYVPIEALRMHGVTSGDPDGYFYPQAPLKRKDAAILISKSFPKNWLNLTPEEANDTLKAYNETPETLSADDRNDIARSIFAGYLLPQVLPDAHGHNRFAMHLDAPLSRLDAARMIYLRALATDENTDKGGQFDPVLAIPAGVTLLLTPTSAISQVTISVSQALYFSLVDPVNLPGLNVMLPRSTRIAGKVISLSADKMQADVNLDNVYLMSGQVYNIAGTVHITFKPPAAKNITPFTVPGETFSVVTQGP